KPRFDDSGQELEGTRCRLLFCRWRIETVELLRACLFRALFHFDSVIDRQIVKLLNVTAWPANDGLHRTLRIAQAKEDFLAVLREKAGACLKVSRLTKGRRHISAAVGGRSFRLDGDRGADGVPIAFCASQPEGDRGWEVPHHIFKKAQLR